MIFLRIEPGFRDPETSTIELQPVTHISGDIDFDYSSKKRYQALIYDFHRILKRQIKFPSIVFELEANFAEEELIFNGPDFIRESSNRILRFFTMSTLFLLPPIFGFTNQIEDHMT